MPNFGLTWPPPWLEDWRSGVSADVGETWLMHPIIPADACIWITGRPKLAKKTYFLLHLIRCLAAGKSIGPFEPTHKDGIRCAILELEGSRVGQEKRWRRLERATGWSVPPNKVLWLHRYPMVINNPDHLGKLCLMIEQYQIKLFLIDSLAKSLKGDENSNEDLGDYFRCVDELRARGCSVAYIDHLHKPRDYVEDIDDEGRGGSAKAAFYDVHLAIRPDGKKLTLRTRDRDGGEHLYDMTWDFSDEKARLDITEYQLEGEVSADILTECAALLVTDTKYSFGALQKLWSIPGDIVDRVIAALVNTGALTKEKKGYKAT